MSGDTMAVKTENCFINTKSPLCRSFVVTLAWPHPLFFICIILSFWECSINRIIPYATFWDQLVFTHYNAPQVHPGGWECWWLDLLLLSAVSWYGWITHYWCIEGHFGCFHFLTTTNKAAMNSRVQVFVFMREMPRNAIAELYGKYVFNF